MGIKTTRASAAISGTPEVRINFEAMHITVAAETTKNYWHLVFEKSHMLPIKLAAS